MNHQVTLIADRLDNIWQKVNERRDYTPAMERALDRLESKAVGTPVITLAELCDANGTGTYDGEAGYFLYRLDKLYDGLREDGDETDHLKLKVMSDTLMELEQAATAL
jgi:hypothetical protein